MTPGMFGRLALAVSVVVALVAGSLVGLAPLASAAAGPRVTSLSVTSGTLTGGTRVTVRGTGFRKVAWVTVGGVRRTFKVLSTTALRITTPAHAAAVVNVRVHTSKGTSAVAAADRFTYVAPPAITTMSPRTGSTAGGTRVTITGSDFLRVSRVTFDSSAGTALQVLSPTKLQVTSPTHAAGAVLIRVVTAYGVSRTSAIDTFTYGAPPQINYLTRSDGTASGGTRIGVVGAGFTPGATVNFGPGKAAGLDVVVDSSSSLEVTTPPHALAGSQIQVTTPYGTSETNANTVFDFTALQLPSPWSAALPIDRASQGFIAVSCPTETFCAAVDRSGYVTLFNGSTWSTPHPLGTPASPASDVSCVSAQWCVALSGTSAYVYNGTTWGSGIDTSTFSGIGISQISCPAVNQCVGVIEGGRVRGFNGAGVGTPVQADDQALTAISCPTTTFCAAVDLAGRAVVAGPSGWSTPVTVSTGETTAVDCFSPTFCAEVDQLGKASLYNGTGWSSAMPVTTGTGLASVACPSATLCVAVDTAGNSYDYTGSAWGPAVSFDVSRLGTTDVDCASPTLCVAVDADGYAVVRSAGTWGSPIPADPNGGGQLTAISCPLTTFCAASDHAGDVLTFDGTVWTPPKHIVGSNSNAPLAGVSCTSATFCLAVDVDGRGFTYNGATWSAAIVPVDTPVTVGSLSCAGPTFCAAGDGMGKVMVFNGTTWGPLISTGAAHDGFRGITSLSCPSTTFCVGVDIDGEAFSYNGTSWGNFAQVTPTSPPTPLTTVSCPSTSFCLALDEYGNSYTSTNGKNWTTVASGATMAPTSVSCSSSSYCEAVGNDPHQAAASMTFDGTGWSPISTLDNGPFTGVSCAADEHCAAVDGAGSYFSFG